MAYYGIEVVQQYMSYVRHNAENAVRSLLKEVAKKSGRTLKAEDFMDDGTNIRLSVAIDPNQGSATFDFRYSFEKSELKVDCVMILLSNVTVGLAAKSGETRTLLVPFRCRQLFTVYVLLWVMTFRLIKLVSSIIVYHVS